MYEVIILSKITHVTKSLTTLIKAEEDLNVIFVTENMTDIIGNHSLSHRIIIVDIKFPDISKFLENYADKHKVLLYSHSKEFSEINKIICKYKINFFNVYTSPTRIIDLIRKTANEKGA